MLGVNDNTAHTESTMGNRGISLLALSFLCGLVWVSAAAAADPSPFASELITPKGWERCFEDGGDCEPSWALGASPEIIVPVGWADTRTAAAAWGGNMCSELVVPPAWNRGSAHSRAR